MPLRRANQLRFWVSNLPLEKRYYLWGALSGAIVKSGGFMASFFALGLTARAIPAESFGRLSTALAALGALQLLDFGIGYAAGNRIAVARLEHPRRSREVVGAMLVFYLAISLGLFCGLQLLPTRLVPTLWLEPKMGLAAWLIATISLATTGFSRVQFVMQHQYIGNIFQLLGGGLTAACTWAMVSRGVTDEAVYFLLLAGVPLAATLGGLSFYGWQQRSHLVPAWGFRSKLFFNLLREAFPFCLSQIASTCLTNLPALFAVAWFGEAVAGGLFLAQRLHLTIYLALTIVLTPIWPLVRNSAASGKQVRLRRLLLRFGGILVLLGLPAYVAAAFWGPTIVDWQSHGKLPLEAWPATILALIYFLSVCRHLLSMVAAGLDSVRLHGVAGLLILAAIQVRIAVPPEHLTDLLQLFVAAEIVVLALAIGDIWLGAQKRGMATSTLGTFTSEIPQTKSENFPTLNALTK